MQNKLIISVAIVGSLFFLNGCSESDGQAEITEESSEYSTSAEEGDVMKSPDLPPNVTLAGNINGGRNSSLVLEANTPKGVLRIAQTYADANGDFILKGAIEDMGLYQLRIEETLKQGQEPKVIPLTLEVNDSVVIKADFNTFNINPVYSNTRWSAALNGYMKEMEKFINWQKSIVNPQQYKQEQLMAMMLKEKKSMDDFTVKSIKNDPANPANILLMTNLYPNMGWEYWDESFLTVLKKMQTGFEKEYPGHPMTINFGAQIAQLESSYNEHIAFTQKNIAPDIEMVDPNGKTRRLSDLRGKYVLIDFWASWCNPCRMENPNVVRVYNEYKNKGFDIFSVSLDTEKDRWKKAITADNLTWANHVSDLKGWQSDVVAQFQFKGIPHTLLLDPEGKIIATNLRGPALEQKLKEVLD
jgi:thiol-disulfide isomerase/thioredoxin